MNYSELEKHLEDTLDKVVERDKKIIAYNNGSYECEICGENKNYKTRKLSLSGTTTIFCYSCDNYSKLINPEDEKINKEFHK